MPLFTVTEKCCVCKKPGPCTVVKGYLTCMTCRRVMRGLPPLQKVEVSNVEA